MRVLSKTVSHKHVITSNFEIPPQVFLFLLHVSPECSFPSGTMLLPPQGYPTAPLWGMSRPPHHQQQQQHHHHHHHHHHQNQQFYGGAGTFPGARHQPQAGPPIGSHNQFIPLQVDFVLPRQVFCVVAFIARSVTRQWTNLALRQVTKKRVSANKKNQETQEFYNAAQAAARHQLQRGQHPPASQSQAQKDKVVQEHQQRATNSNTTSSSPTSGDAVAATTAAMCTPPRQNMPATGHTPGSASKRKHRKLAVNFEAAKVSE